MRILKNKRGQVRVIEAFFAAVLLLSSMTLIPAFQKTTNDSNTVLSSKALNILESLDSDGHLATLVDEKNWTALQSLLESVIPPALWFNITVIGEDINALNPYPICSGSAISDHIEASEYICASTSSTFAVYTLRLQLAGLD